MADNVTDPNGNIFATDQQAGTVHYPISKLAHGALDTFTLVSAAAPLPVTEGAGTTWDHGSNRDIDLTPEQVLATSGPARHGVWVKASPNNLGIVYIGNSDLTANTADATDGWPLAAGEEAYVRVSDANLIYCRADTANQIIFWRTD